MILTKLKLVNNIHVMHFFGKPAALSKIKLYSVESKSTAANAATLEEESNYVTTRKPQIIPSEIKYRVSEDTSVLPNETSLLEVVPRSQSSFDEMPGPFVLTWLAKKLKTLPVIGTHLTGGAVQYVLGGGKMFGGQMGWQPNSMVFKYMLDNYGPIIRLQGPFGGNVVIMSRAEHATKVFENEGPYPIRSALDSLEKYRLEHRKHEQDGPFQMYGPDWIQLRASIESSLRRCDGSRIEQWDKTGDEFLARIMTIRNKQDEVPASFDKEMIKWSLECLCSELVHRRIGFLDPCGLSPTSDAARMLGGFVGATEGLRQCEIGFHLWKLFKTPTWNLLVKNCEVIESVLQKFVERTQNEFQSDFEDEKNLSLIGELLIKEKLSPDSVISVLLDMLFIGVNSTVHVVNYLLYYLAKNPRCQAKAFEEVRNSPDHLGKNDFDKLPYLEACLKESLRLAPPMPVLSRVLTQDITVHNYEIPRGTYVLIATHMSGLKDEVFEDAHKFKPERWFDKTMLDETHSLAYVPFGVGPKACVAKDFAEMQIQTLMVKLLKKFRIEYYYGEMKNPHTMLMYKNRPTKFRFIDRI